MVILALAAWLKPDSRGFDTHTQLNLPPCSFVQTTGYYCPTCGMTTAFANLAHGRVGQAFTAQAGGALLAIATAWLALVGTAQLVTGRDLLQKLRPSVGWLWLALGLVVVGWAIKLAVGVAQGALPMR